MIKDQLSVGMFAISLLAGGGIPSYPWPKGGVVLSARDYRGGFGGSTQVLTRVLIDNDAFDSDRRSP